MSPMIAPESAEHNSVGASPQPLEATRKYAIKADAVIVAPCEKLENFRILKTSAKPMAIRLYTAPVEIPFNSIWSDKTEFLL